MIRDSLLIVKNERDRPLMRITLACLHSRCGTGTTAISGAKQELSNEGKKKSGCVTQPLFLSQILRRTAR